jgi:hypothetical protein
MLRKLGHCSNGASGWRRSCWWFGKRGPKLHTRFAGHAASRIRNAPGQSGHAASGDRNTPGPSSNAASGDRNTPGQSSYATNWSGYASESKLSRIRRAEHNPHPKYAGINFPRNSDARQHHPAFDDQSKYAEHAGNFAQRFSMWHFTWHPQRIAGLRAKRRSTKQQPIDSGNRKQPK